MTIYALSSGPGISGIAVIRVSGIKTVSESSIQAAMRLFHQVGHKVEPTGALTLGSLLENPPEESRIVAVISGGNVDSSLYNSIID